MWLEPETPSTEETGGGLFDLFSQWTCRQKLLEFEEARAAAIFSRLMNCSLQASHFIFILRSGGLFNLMKNTRGRGNSLLHHNMPKVSLPLYKWAQPGTEEEWQTVSRVDNAQWWRHSAEAWTVHLGSQQSQIELGNEGNMGFCGLSRDRRGRGYKKIKQARGEWSERLEPKSIKSLSSLKENSWECD